MSDIRALIDTNVLIALEDPGRTQPIAAELSRRCQSKNAKIFIHPAMREDFERDRNAVRRSVSKSRMDKYPILQPIPMPHTDLLEEKFGAIKNDNDRVDIALLHALSLNVVDILITQDGGLHKRVRGSTLENRVLTIADAVDWLRALHEDVADDVSLVVQMPAYSINMEDPIFRSLESDYDGFDTWWYEKCVAEHRDCWLLRGNDGLIDGLIIRKTERGTELGFERSKRLLKLCTFKVAARAQGHKVGELLLRKAIWHAQLNEFDAVYVTTYPKQVMLIELFERYGFVSAGNNGLGEIILVKNISRERVESSRPSKRSVRENYPRFGISSPVNIYVVPVQWRFHKQLFPEIAKLVPMPLFNDDSRDESDAGRTPANTIRKVYVCRSQISSLQPGDVLFFYQSKKEAATHSQSLTTVGVVESVERSNDAQELIRLTAGRSVYSEKDLRTTALASTKAVTNIDFLLIKHLDLAIALNDLIEYGALKAPPQSITQLDRVGLDQILPSMQFGFAL